MALAATMTPQVSGGLYPPVPSTAVKVSFASEGTMHPDLLGVDSLWREFYNIPPAAKIPFWTSTNLGELPQSSGTIGRRKLSSQSTNPLAMMGHLARQASMVNPSMSQFVPPSSPSTPVLVEPSTDNVLGNVAFGLSLLGLLVGIVLCLLYTRASASGGQPPAVKYQAASSTTPSAPASVS